MPWFTRFSFVGVILLVAASAAAQIDADKIDRGLQTALRSGAARQHVIVSVRPGYLPTVRKALTDHGDRIKAVHPTIGALSADIHTTDVADLARLSWVESIALDATVFSIGADQQFSQAEPLAGDGGSRASLNPLRETLGLAVPATGNRGGHSVVAVIDSGLAPSGDLSADRVDAFYDLTGTACTPGPCASAAFDDFGHGTHVAGLIGSSGVLSGNRFQGVAPAVRFVGVKVLDATGAGKTSDVISAIELLITHKFDLGIGVINLSLGHQVFAPGRLDPLVRVVEQAAAAGIVVIVAAGNDGQVCPPPDATAAIHSCTGPYYATINSPGNAPSAITVGATDSKATATRADDLIAPYSSHGPAWFDALPKPDVVAPGHHLWSDATGVIAGAGTLWSQCLSAENARSAVFCHEGKDGSAQFLRLSGTSMSAAVASGVAALMLNANSRLTPNIVKAILEYTAIPLPNLDLFSQGMGEINAAGAVLLSSSINTDAPAGTWWLGAGLSPSTPIGGVAAQWAQGVLWGQKVLGGDLVYRNVLLWSPKIEWGANLKWTSDTRLAKSNEVNIIWGTADNIIWGTSDNIIWGTVDTISWGLDKDALWAGSLVHGVPNMLVGGLTKSAARSMFFGPDTTIRAYNLAWLNNRTWTDDIVWDKTRRIQWIGHLAPNRIIGTFEGDNIIWGTFEGDNIIWGTFEGDNIIWGTWEGDNIIWGTDSAGENIIWGTFEGDNIIWGTFEGDNIIWGTSFGLLW